MNIEPIDITVETETDHDGFALEQDLITYLFDPRARSKAAHPSNHKPVTT